MTLEVQNLFFQYNSLGHTTSALSDLSLRVDHNELVALLGPSGSGKSTLMQHFTGLLKPTKGRILIDGSDLWENEAKFTEVRRRIGLVFQFPETQLFEETVYADVAFGPRNLGLSHEEVEARVREAIAAVSLDFERLRERVPTHLSEGEKRRVAIAGVLAMDPEFLVLDEPTAGLDQSGQEAVIRLLKAFHAQGKNVLLITHHLELVASLAKRAIVLNEGRLGYDGPVSELFANAVAMKDLRLSPPRILSVVEALRNLDLLQGSHLSTLEEIKTQLSKSPRLTRLVSL